MSAEKQLQELQAKLANTKDDFTKVDDKVWEITTKIDRIEKEAKLS